MKIEVTTTQIIKIAGVEFSKSDRHNSVIVKTQKGAGLVIENLEREFDSSQLIIKKPFWIKLLNKFGSATKIGDALGIAGNNATGYLQCRNNAKGLDVDERARIIDKVPEINLNDF